MNSRGIILVVDDDSAVRSLAARILRRGGYQVLEAANAQAARDVAREAGGPPALLLADVVLPGTDGATLARALRQDWPGLRVIFMSGYEEHELERRGIQDVGDAYVTKPFTAEVLSLVVRGALEEEGS